MPTKITNLTAKFDSSSSRMIIAYKTNGERQRIFRSRDEGKSWFDTGIRDSGGNEPVPYVGKARYRLKGISSGQLSNETPDVDNQPAIVPAPTNLRLMYEASSKRIDVRYDDPADGTTWKVYADGRFVTDDSNAQAFVPFGGVDSIKIGVIAIKGGRSSDAAEKVYTASSSTPPPEPQPTNGAPLPPPTPRPTRFVRTNGEIGTIKAGEIVGIEDGVQIDGEIDLLDGAGIVPADPSIIFPRLINTNVTSEFPTHIDMRGKSAHVGPIKFVYAYPTKRKAQAIAAGGDDQIIDRITWDGSISRLLMANHPTRRFRRGLIYKPSSYDVLGSKAADASKNYGIYLSRPTAWRIVLGESLRVRGNMTLRIMDSIGECRLWGSPKSLLESLDPERNIAIRGTEPGASVILDGFHMRGGQAELGNDSVSSGREQGCDNIEFHNFTMDKPLMVSVAGAGHATLKNGVIAGHQRGNVFSLSRGVVTDEKPTVDVIDVRVEGNCKTWTNEGYSAKQHGTCTINGKVVAA